MKKIMIEPENITNYEMSYTELEENILFWILTAGKTAKMAAIVLNEFLKKHKAQKQPFQKIKKVSEKEIAKSLRSAGSGCYNQKARTIYELVNSNINLKTCSIEELEKIKGIGRKTSRCYVMHSRENSNHAGLDVHIMRFLKEKGYTSKESTPSSKKEYERLEKIFIGLAKKKKKNIAEYDLEIWNRYAKNFQKKEKTSQLL